MNRDDLQQILISLLNEATERPGGAAGDKSDGGGKPEEPAFKAAVPLWAPAADWGTNPLQRLLDATQAQTEKIAENTKALVESASGRGGGIATAVKGVIGGGIPGVSLVTSPLISLAAGLAKLFGGGEGSEPAAPVRYRRPEGLNLEAGWMDPTRTMSGVDHDFQGRPRPVPAASLPAVTVNVQAMDSRSFLDHSDEIARAVREAILNSHSLNELLTDL